MMSDLRRITGASRGAIRTAISRLRDEKFDIVTRGSGDPKYELLSGPESLSSSFVCPKCSLLIRLGHPEDHEPSCAFGKHVNLNGNLMS
jgi:hypothetical protein